MKHPRNDLPRRLSHLALCLGLAQVATGHDLGSDLHPHYDRSVVPPGINRAPQWFFAQANTAQPTAPAPSGTAAQSNRPTQAAPFDAFAPRVKLRWDEKFLYIENNGIPAHGMMVGITAWQQQVPLPQNYTGANAWQLPLHPVPAKTPVSIKGRFLRGAIALAANGIPIFNPQNNRGEVSAEIGELDEWGGHCGRADDYHYHAAPLHLQNTVGKSQPIAFALDGYAIYGLSEPDGSMPAGLDAFNGHSSTALGYHYHASKKYPYVNGGFHGEVLERENQVDPQPRAQPVRKDLPPLRGAKITGFTAALDEKSFDLKYTINDKPGEVIYTAIPPSSGGGWKFQFVGVDGTKRDETYFTNERRSGAGPRDRRPPRPAEPGANNAPATLINRAAAPAPAATSVTKPSGTFVLRSPEVVDNGTLPAEFTGDGASSTLPLEWSGAPAGTKSYALIMHHIDPEGKAKWYWTIYNIPATVSTLPKNVKGIGTLGNNGINDQLGYAPPHSKGPGAKIYVLTLYALSAPPQISTPAAAVNREVLLAAMKGLILGSAELHTVYTRTGDSSAQPSGPEPGKSRPNDAGGRPPRDPNRTPAGDRRPGNDSQPPTEPAPRAQTQTDSQPGAANLIPSAIAQAPERRSGPGGPGPGEKGGPDNKWLIKPALSDTIKVNVYADNWFVLYINGKLTAVDPIEFTPHNVVSIDILPEYPMTIAVLAKDNADPKTGLEYGDHIGDGGFIIKFADGTVSNATWKAKNFFKGPLNRDPKNPTVEHTPIPDKWWSTDFDDSKWSKATEYSQERVNPKEAFYKADFAGAKFIWSEDLDLDNTIIFRTKIEKPGWQKRWNTKPDLDVTGAPFK